MLLKTRRESQRCQQAPRERERGWKLCFARIQRKTCGVDVVACETEEKHKKPRPRRIFPNNFFSAAVFPSRRVESNTQLSARECFEKLWVCFNIAQSNTRWWKRISLRKNFSYVRKMNVSYTNNRNITQLNWFSFLLFLFASLRLRLPAGIKSNDVHWCLNSFHNVFIYYSYVYHLTLSLPA